MELWLLSLILHGFTFCSSEALGRLARFCNGVCPGSHSAPPVLILRAKASTARHSMIIGLLCDGLLPVSSSGAWHVRKSFECSPSCLGKAGVPVGEIHHSGWSAAKRTALTVVWMAIVCIEANLWATACGADTSFILVAIQLRLCSFCGQRRALRVTQ